MKLLFSCSCLSEDAAGEVEDRLLREIVPRWITQSVVEVTSMTE